MCSWVKIFIKMCLRVHVQRQKAHNSAVRLRGCVFDDRLVLPTGLKGEPFAARCFTCNEAGKGFNVSCLFIYISLFRYDKQGNCVMWS